MAKSDKPKRFSGTKAVKPRDKAAKRGGSLPLPNGVPATGAAARVPKAVRRAEARHLEPLSVAVQGAGEEILEQLWQTVEQRRLSGDVGGSHSARLLSRGTAKVAQKLGEEAVEGVIEAALGHREGVVLESADLLYHLIVVWVDAGIRPGEVWAELARRRGISGIAEKASRPKAIVRAAQTTKLP